MSFPRYESYKNSGVEWLGDVPSQWEVSTLKRLASLRSGDAITAEDIEETGEFPAYGGNGLRGYTATYTHDGQYVLVGRQGALCGNINYAFGKFWASEHAVVVTPLRQVAVFWLGELLRAMNLNQYSVSAAQPGLSVEAVSNLRIPVPSLSEQSAIAAFLNRETAKIDTLVDEQKRLVELLTEKRQAVISHAVTKGLNPNAPMKHSGVEWLGDVPQHWDVRRIKRFTRSIEQGWSPQCEGFPVGSSNEWGVLKVGCVNGGIFNASENKTLPPDLKPLPELGIVADDLLVSRANTRELVGSAAVATESHPNLMLCDKLYRLRLETGLCSPNFLSWFLGTGNARGQIALSANGASSSMLNIGQDTLRELSVALPPVSEQATIAAFLDREIAKIGALTTEAESATALLQERRSALIFAAVTGKIDVRKPFSSEAEAA